jgi:hypothetical protein
MPVVERAAPMSPGTQTNLSGNNSEAREPRVAMQTANSRYKIEKPKQLESNSDLELWWSRFKDYKTWAGATADTIKNIMMPLFGDSVHKRIEMAVKHKRYATY